MGVKSGAQEDTAVPAPLVRHLQQYFSYIMAVSFSGGGNRRTQGKTTTYLKSLTNFIT
jgi:hypothetical protein